MSLKNKMSLSCNSMTWAGSFENRTKTNHRKTCNTKESLNLVHKLPYGIIHRRICERDFLL